MEGYLVMDKPQSPRNSNNNNRNTTTSNTSSYILPDTGFSNKMAKSVSAPWQNQEPPPYTNDYLTPTNPDQSKAHAQRPQVPALPPGGFGRQTSGTSQSSVKSRDGDGRHIPRADSGIEADFRARGLSSTSTVNPRSSTIYECIDSNQYTEPSPHFFCGPSSGGETTSSGVSTAPTSALLPSAASDSEDGLDDNVRRRLHPAYSTLNHSTPQVYTETCRCAASTSKKALGDRDSRGSGALFASPRHLCYLWCGLALLTVLTLFLFGTIAYVFFYLIPGMQAHIRVQEDDLKRMQSDYRNLSERVDTLLWYPTANQTLSTSAVTQRTMAEGVAVKIAELNNSVQEVGSQLQQLGTDLQFQIDNMSHVPDLKAVSAVGNLGSCFYYKTTSTQALPGPASTTSWLPTADSDQLRDNVVMSVSCGVEGGDLHFVERRELSAAGQVQFRCRCDGKLPGHDRRKCLIHLVLCPRKLPVDLAVAEPPASK